MYKGAASDDCRSDSGNGLLNVEAVGDIKCVQVNRVGSLTQISSNSRQLQVA